MYYLITGPNLLPAVKLLSAIFLPQVRVWFVELQISHFVNFTQCEEFVPIRHFWQMLNLRTINLEDFWGVRFVFKFHILYCSNV